MIVLGPHVLSHRPHDDGGDDRGPDDEGDGDGDGDGGDDDHRKEEDDEEGADEDVDDRDHDAGALADGCLGDRRRAVDDGADDEADDGGDDGDAAACLRIWTDARLAASAALGSIGAPPLSTPPPRDRRRRHSRSRGMPLLCIAATDMAHAHSDLLRSMRAVLGTLRAGTSVRLGLGPIGWSGGGGVVGGCLAGRDDGGLPVARAERAWAERALAGGRRRRRRNEDDGYDDDGHENSRSDDNDDNGHGDNNGHGDETPAAALTFQKLRDVLHRAIADQASSLRNALGHCRRDDGATAATTTTTTTTTATTATMAEWETFAIDLRLSATTARRLPLTLSRLSDWIDRLGGYLSFVPPRGGVDAVRRGDVGLPPFRVPDVPSASGGRDRPRLRRRCHRRCG